MNKPPSHQIIKQTALLKQKKQREETGLLLVEGRHPIEEAYKAGLKLAHWFYQADAPTTQLPQVAKLPAGFDATEKQLAQMSSTSSAPPCLAVFEKPMPREWQATGFTLVLDDIQDPGNVGTLIRSARAFGAEQVLLTPNSADPYQPKVIRSSAGLIFELSVCIMPIDRILSCFQQAKLACYLAVSDAAAQDYTQIQYTVPGALVLGNEGQGLSQQWVTYPTQHRIIIPMDGRVESLNVGVSGSIILAEAANQRRR